jgi:fumarate reductase flavoprotein subunit
MPTLSYEEIDISKMEMPPAFRGYGKKGAIILNPLSEKREDEIEKIKETLGAVDRFTVQEAVMPFDLQKEYKRKNERVGVGYD